MSGATNELDVQYALSAHCVQIAFELHGTESKKLLPVRLELTTLRLWDSRSTNWATEASHHVSPEIFIHLCVEEHVIHKELYLLME